MPRHDPLPREDLADPRSGRETDRSDALVFEAVELAGVLAEEVVQSHGRPGRPSGPRGWSRVTISFIDFECFASFRRLDLLRRCSGLAHWALERRWAEAHADLRLDEEMCLRVVTHLNEVFAGRLRARVLSHIAS